MAKRLTEEMVIARTKISDLSKIKRLNCWGSELVDVSLLRRMPNVEVLSLSINKINSLADFELCRNLQELFIRQNDIRDLNQVCYLQNLPNLKILWLGENPCAKTDGYRNAVLRALPQLQKLDNVQVSPEELKEALKKGRVLTHPEDPQDSDVEEEEDYTAQQPTNQYNSGNNNNNSARYHQQEYQNESEYSPPRSSPLRQDHDYDNDFVEVAEWKDDPEEIINSEYSPPRQRTPPSRQQEQVRRSYSPEQEYANDRRTNSYDQDSPKHSQYYDRLPPYTTTTTTTTTNSTEEGNGGAPPPPADNFRDLRLVNSSSTNSIKQEYTNGDRYSHSRPESYRQQEGSEISSHSQDGNNQPQQPRRERYQCPASHRPPFNRRPVTRNSNILSAVLCLVKELDYPSLEVVEMAVRCRMDELDE